MKIKLNNNQGFEKILRGELKDILIDANIFIPPDRSGENSKIKPIEFEYYKRYWLEPFVETFKPVGIHEAIYSEFNTNSIKKFIDRNIEVENIRIVIHRDSDLKEKEEVIRRTIEADIAKNTNYKPALDNSADRGEVKSLAYIAAKGLLYFCSHDANAIRLIEDAEVLETSLDLVSAIQPYEIMYYFSRKEIVENKVLRNFYKYMYCLTKKEKEQNPEWIMFLEKMDEIYRAFI